MSEITIDTEAFNALLDLSLHTHLSNIDAMGLNYDKFLEHIEDEEKILINQNIDSILCNYLNAQTKEWHDTYNDMDNPLFNVKLFDLDMIFYLSNNFYDALDTLSKEYPEAIEAFQQMHIDPEKKTFRGLYASIKKHQKEFDKKISQHSLKDKMIELITQVDTYYNHFMSQYYQHRLTMLSDEILSYEQSNSTQKFNVSLVPIELLQDKKTIYIDQNIISYYENKNSKNHIIIKELKENHHLICSVYAIEDSVKRHAIFFKDYLYTLGELCDNLYMGKIGNSIEIVTEDTQTILDRISLWLRTTEHAEQHYAFTRKMHFHIYPSLREKFPKEFDAEKLISFLEEIEKESEISQILKSKIVFYQNINLQNLINNKIDTSGKSDKEISKIIEDLCSILDLLNFQTCKINNDKLLKSSYQDIQHLQHAWKADIFLTADKALYERAKYIYQLLKLPVEPQLFTPSK